jgi:hypothetical protein
LYIGEAKPGRLGNVLVGFARTLLPRDFITVRVGVDHPAPNGHCASGADRSNLVLMVAILAHAPIQPTCIAVQVLRISFDAPCRYGRRRATTNIRPVDAIGSRWWPTCTFARRTRSSLWIVRRRRGWKSRCGRRAHDGRLRWPISPIGGVFWLRFTGTSLAQPPFIHALSEELDSQQPDMGSLPTVCSVQSLREIPPAPDATMMQNSSAVLLDGASDASARPEMGSQRFVWFHTLWSQSLK